MLMDFLYSKWEAVLALPTNRLTEALKEDESDIPNERYIMTVRFAFHEGVRLWFEPSAESELVR